MRSANLLFIAVLAASPLMAQTPPPPPAAEAAPAEQASSDTSVIPARVEGVATVGDLARVMSQRLMAEERKKLNEAQGGSSSGESAPSVSADGTPAASAPAGTSRRPYESPVVVGIHGSASAPYALVRVSDATVLSVRPGDSLPGGLRVERVAPQGVTVRDAVGTRTLGFSAAVDLPSPGAAAARR